MSDKVVRLRGQTPVHHPGNPDKDLIEGLRWLLERAEAGEIVGIAYSIVYHDEACSSHYVGAISNSLVGGITRVSNRICIALDKPSE